MIVIENVTKRYGAQTAVDDVSFRCEPGSVTGFLGPNGAGKSTTMRVLCGLTPPSAGSSTVNGVPYRDLPNPGLEVGVLLDASAQHPGRTGREVLRLTASVLGVDDRSVQTMLDRVGLDARAARKRVGGYSLGMRQRLGLAVALLGRPSVLVLDEPANGLDPEGIAWMRGLLREFADAGGTVLLSSHLLMEVEAVADHLVMIGNGKIAADGAKDELLAGTGTTVSGEDPAALGAALTAAGLRFAPTTGAFRVEAEPVVVGRAAAAAGGGADPVADRRRRGPGTAVLPAHRHPGGDPMSATATTGRDQGRSRGELYRPGLLRLTTVEMRKMVDTRSGFWLLLAIAVISVIGVVLGVWLGAPADRTLQNFYQLTLTPLSLVLPVLGVLLVTTEWSTRTALTTFSLVPRRGRVAVAKVLAGTLFALLSGLVSLLAATVGFLASWALGRTAGGDTGVVPAAIAGGLVYLVIVTLVGIAFGMLLMNTPAAIVLYFVLPNALAILAAAVPRLTDALTRLDLSGAARPLNRGELTAEDAGHLVTAVLFWIGLPLVLGWLRLLRREVK